MCRAGDRLVTVNDTFVVFLPVAEVEELLSEGGATVAWLEVLYCTVLYCTILCTVYCSWSGRPCGLSSRRGSWRGGSPARGR